MTEKKQTSNHSKELRTRAEQKVSSDAANNQEALLPEETRRMLHELRVHQIELEIQNEELRQTQLELESSRQRYFVQHEIAPVGFFTLNEKGLILEANITAATMLGVLKSALVSKLLTSFILPEDQDIYYLHSKKLFETGALQVCELRLMKKGGTPLWARLEATVVRDVDGALVSCTVMSDISENKQAEESQRESEGRYQLLFEGSRDGVVRVDNKGSFLDANRAYCDMLGYSLEELRAMKDFYSITSIQLTDWEHEEIWNSRLLKQGYTGVYEKEYIRKGGAVFPVEVQAFAIFNENRELLYIWGVVRDITDRKRLKEELIQVKKFETMSTFSAGIAHDFNNLPAGVLNYIILSKDDINKPEDALKFLDEAEKIIFKAKDVTDEFLTLSGAAIEYKNTDEPCKLIKDTASISVQGSKVKCEFMLPSEEREVIIASRLLSQIISNVVENSREAMPDGGIVKIKAEHITCKEKDKLPLKNGRYFFMRISDTGCGISKEHLPRIFDPYYSTKERGVQKGMGLGLAVVYSIVTRLNGYIRVESQEGVGTEVFIYLPAAGEPAVRDEKKKETKVAKINVEARAATGIKRILFMDDEESLRATAKIMLEKAGYTVEVAERGEEALQKYVLACDSGIPFDAVILDLFIVGGMGGVETIKKLLEINPQVKAIVSSGYSNYPVIYNYAQYGFQGSFTKPATRAQMVEALKKLC